MKFPLKGPTTLLLALIKLGLNVETPLGGALLISIAASALPDSTSFRAVSPSNE